MASHVVKLRGRLLDARSAVRRLRAFADEPEWAQLAPLIELVDHRVAVICERRGWEVMP